MSASNTLPIVSAASTPLGRPLAAPGPLDARASAVMTLLCLIWSLQQISLKAIAEQASPMLMVPLRSGIALLLLALLMHRRGEKPEAGRWLPGAVVGASSASNTWAWPRRCD